MKRQRCVDFTEAQASQFDLYAPTVIPAEAGIYKDNYLYGFRIKCGMTKRETRMKIVLGWVIVLIDILKAILLGVVKGLTEFLPISSTGHLILINQWIGFEDSFTVMFDIVIQLGAILSVVVYFWKRFWPINSIWGKIIAGVMPALVLGGLFGDFIEKRLFNPEVVGMALFIGGLALISVEKEISDLYFLLKLGENGTRGSFISFEADSERRQQWGSSG